MYLIQVKAAFLTIIHYRPIIGLLAPPLSNSHEIYLIQNKSDISYLKTSRAFDVSDPLRQAKHCWLVTL